MELAAPPGPGPGTSTPAAAPQPLFVPSRFQRIAPGLALGATAACGCVAVALWNPGDHGTPLCWSQAIFGFDCPFCGGLRCANSLLRGHPLAAADHNVLLAVALPVTALMWAVWMVRRWRGEEDRHRAVPRWLWALTVVLLVAFTVVRNLGGPAWARWLHSDTFRG